MSGGCGRNARRRRLCSASDFYEGMSQNDVLEALTPAAGRLSPRSVGHVELMVPSLRWVPRLSDPGESDGSCCRRWWASVARSRGMLTGYRAYAETQSWADVATARDGHEWHLRPPHLTGRGHTGTPGRPHERVHTP
jgi:hypothetical protein